LHWQEQDGVVEVVEVGLDVGFSLNPTLVEPAGVELTEHVAARGGRAEASD